MTTKEDDGVSADVKLEELYADEETNIRPIERCRPVVVDEKGSAKEQEAQRETQSKHNEEIASFIVSVGQKGVIGSIRVRPKGSKGYPVTFGFQRVGAAQFITRANELVDKMLDITEREQKLPEEKQAEGLKDERDKVEKEYGDFLHEFLTWKDTEAAKTALTELRGAKASEKDPFSLTEVSKLLKSWLPRIQTIPVRIFEDKNEIDRIFLQLAENIDRQALSPIAEARAVEKLVDYYVEKKSMSKIPAMELVGQRLGGRCLSWVQQSLGLLKTSSSVQEALERKDISRSQGLVIARAKTKGDQDALVERAVKGATVKVLNKIRKPAKATKKKDKPGAQKSLLPTGPRLEFKVGKHALVFEEADAETNEFSLTVDGEEALRLQVTRKGAIKVQGPSSEILSLKTDLGHLEIQHDTSTEGRFSVDVDGVERGALVLVGKGEVEYEVTKKGDQQPPRTTKGKKKSGKRKAKAAATA